MIADGGHGHHRQGRRSANAPAAPRRLGPMCPPPDVTPSAPDPRTPPPTCRHGPHRSRPLLLARYPHTIAGSAPREPPPLRRRDRVGSRSDWDWWAPYPEDDGTDESVRSNTPSIGSPDGSSFPTSRSHGWRTFPVASPFRPPGSCAGRHLDALSRAQRARRSDHGGTDDPGRHGCTARLRSPAHEGPVGDEPRVLHPENIAIRGPGPRLAHAGRAVAWRHGIRPPNVWRVIPRCGPLPSVP